MGELRLRLVVEHRAGITADGRILAWDRENWVASLGNRPGYDQPGNVISGMLAGYPPEPLEPGPAKPPAGRLRNRSNTVPSYFAGCIAGKCGGGGTIRSERVLTHTVRSPFFTGPLRSPLRIQNTFANECFMDELCAHAKADPVAFRLQHLRDSRVIGVLKAAARAAGWAPRPSPITERSRKTGVVNGRGIACVAYEGENGYAALVAEVTVDLESGLVRPVRFVVALDCGPVSNPDGLRNQIEGGILQGTSRALVEEVTWDDRRITSVDWETYHSLHLDYEIPTIESCLCDPGWRACDGCGRDCNYRHSRCHRKRDLRCNECAPAAICPLLLSASKMRGPGLPCFKAPTAAKAWYMSGQKTEHRRHRVSADHGGAPRKIQQPSATTGRRRPRSKPWRRHYVTLAV